MHIVDMIGLVAAVLDVAAFIVFVIRFIFRVPLDKPSPSVQASLGCLGCLIGAVTTIFAGLWGGYYVIQQFWNQYIRMLGIGRF